MRIWCSGTPEFVSEVRAAVAGAAPLEEGARPSGRDTLVVELDGPDPDAAIGVVERWAPRLRVLVACAPDAMGDVVRAVRKGAQQVVPRPVTAAALAPRRPAAEAERDELDRWRARFAPEILGDAPALRRALEVAMRASDSDAPVLITGESGTGKELLAQALHRASPRARAPFIPVNCPAIPRELVESELFGHAKGAFTGATSSRVGRFAAADGGTLFLDEIGEMELDVQCKLLRVLQDYQITPVGESRPRKVDVRVIAATNRDLEGRTAKGQFREDLYYRLNVVQIHLPPLRERREDLPLLVDTLLANLAEQRGVPAPTLAPAAREALVAYRWPGNIRQLRNVLERLVILHRGALVETRDLPACVTRAGEPGDAASLLGNLELPSGGIDLRREMQRFEEAMIRKALIATKGNKNQAARILGLNRTTLVEKLRRQPIAIAC